MMISAVTVVELLHGVYRARTDQQRESRHIFAETVLHSFDIEEISLPIARIAAKLDGEEASRGNVVDLADLLIAATAIHLKFSVATYNLRHFQAIPDVQVLAF